MAPSIKLRRPSGGAIVPRWLRGSHEEWVEGKLEAEAADAPERRREARAQALLVERDGVARRLAGLEGVADAQRVEVPYVAPHEWPSAGERRAQLAERLRAIDRELERVSD